MTAKGLLINVDGSTREHPVDTWQDIAGAVGGNFDWTSQTDILFYCYEYALYEQKVNPVATALYHAHNASRDPLAGAVLVVGKADMEGNETDVPDGVIAEVERLKVELQPSMERLAQPLSDAQKKVFEQRNEQALQQMRQAFTQGHGVDMGGIVILPPGTSL